MLFRSDEIREKILAKAGNLPFNIYGDRSVPPFFRYLMTGNLTDPATVEIFGTLDRDKVENITVKYYSNYNKSNQIEPAAITTRLADIFTIKSWTPANKSVTVTPKPDAKINGANAMFWSMEYKEGKMVSHDLEDLDEIREKILAKAGNLPFNIYGDRSVPPFFRYLMTGNLTDPATGTDTVGTQWKCVS